MTAILTDVYGKFKMRMRDELGSVYTDERFIDLFAVRGQPAESAGCLALVTVMRFVEGLSARLSPGAAWLLVYSSRLTRRIAIAGRKGWPAAGDSVL